jgi:hypothetical protein
VKPVVKPGVKLGPGVAPVPGLGAVVGVRLASAATADCGPRVAEASGAESGAVLLIRNQPDVRREISSTATTSPLCADNSRQS